jgi:riboflavin synthase
MFSGIIEELGKVAKIIPKSEGGAGLEIEAPLLATQSGIGDSVAVNGVCLTVVDFPPERFGFDLSAETLRVTNLGRLQPRDPVNLELSLKVGDRLGGHFVSGHIDGVGLILSKTPEGDCTVVRLNVGENLTKLLIDRGSVAIDGISLTVTKIAGGEIEVVIIPHTAAMTTLGAKGPQDEVNVEADMIGKYVAKLLGKTPE